MNGRCTADPLDHADDICEFCGDEFCRSCLISTRGGKGQLICRECAISNSGIKGSKSSKPRVSRSQIARARATLLESKSTRQAKTFQFFDEDDDYVAPMPDVVEATLAETPAADPDTRPAKRRFNLRRKSDHDPIEDDSLAPPADDPTVASESEPESPAHTAPSGRSTPATTLIESGALASTPPGTLPSPMSAPSPTTQPSPTTPPDTITAPETAPLDAGEVATSTPASAVAATSTDGHRAIPTPDATTNVGAPTSLADRLRARPAASDRSPAPTRPAVAPEPPMGGAKPAPRGDQPLAEGFDAQHLAVDPFAVAPSGFPEAAAVPEHATPVVDVSFHAAASSDPFETPSAAFEWQTPAVRPQSNPTASALDDDPFAAGDPFSSTNDTMPAPRPAPPVHDVEAPRFEAMPAPEPMVFAEGEVPRQRAVDQFLPPVESLPERRSTPTPAVAPTTDARVSPTPSAPAVTPRPSVAPQPMAPAGAVADSSATVHAAADPMPAPSPKSTADTDANGNWIPPLLRGMAPVAERRADQLPRRREAD